MVSVMMQIGDKIVSRELFDEQFICHLEKCEGNCCVFGDAGAPLEDNEAAILDEQIHILKDYLRPEGMRSVGELGPWVVDDDGEKVTPLVGREECAYAVFENGIAFCAIEKAWQDGKLDFRKPLSCHLYPIRVSRLSNAVALNYHRWGICEAARILGTKEGLPVFRFLKEAIVRAYGNDFYKEMEMVYSELRRIKNEDQD
jgi:hypothetical protein